MSQRKKKVKKTHSRVRVNITSSMSEGVVVTVCVLLAIAFVVFRLSLVVVRARTFVVVERLGQFSRVLYPGAHFLLPTVEYVRGVVWSYRGQDGRFIQLKSSAIPAQDAQMDVPPYDCITRDQIPVRVDGVVLYNIVDPQKAVYQVRDLLNHTEQVIRQAVVQIARAKDFTTIDDNANIIGREIINYANEKLKNGELGIVLKEYIVQEIGMDPAVRRENQKQYAEERRAKVESEVAQRRHETEMQAIQLARAKAIAERENKQTAVEGELALSKLRFEQEIYLERERFEQEYKRHHAAEQRLVDLGFTPQDIVQMHHALNLGKALENGGGKTVLAPLEYFTRPVIGGLTLHE